MGLTSCEGRNAICPGLDPGPDAVVLVGREGDLLAGEVHVEHLPAGVMAPEGCRVTVPVRGVDRRAAVGRAVRDVCEDGCDAGVKPGDRVVRVCCPADCFCILVLVHDSCCVRLPDLFYGRVAGARAHIRYTPERIVQDNGLDHRVERADVRDGFRKFADRTLHVGVLCEVCHFFHLLFCSVSRGAR